MKPKILIALSSFAKFSDTPLKLLKNSQMDYSVNALGRRLRKEEIINLGKNFDGIVAGLEPYDAEVLDHLTQLKCISRCGVGVDNVDLAVAKQKNITIKNTPDVIVLPVAEHTIALIFDLLRKISYHSRLMRQRQWQRSVGAQLAGKKIGVLGLGKIGKKVAELLKKLDVNVYGSDLTVDKTWAEKNKIKIVPVTELLKVCDVVTVHVGVSANQPPILGAPEIAKMKSGAYLVNTARGRAVDEKALYKALKSGHLAGAALDVYEEEPHDGPLCDLDNVLLTPHIATFTRESRVQMECEAVQNAIDFFG